MPIVTPRADAALTDHMAKSNEDRRALAQRQNWIIQDWTRPVSYVLSPGILQVAQNYGAGTSGDPINVVLPHAPTAGNTLLLIVGAGTESPTTWTPPTGFTFTDQDATFANNGVAYFDIAFATRTVGSSDSATWSVHPPSVPWASIIGWWAILYELVGVTLLNHVFNSTSSGQDIATSITPSAYPALVISTAAMGILGYSTPVDKQANFEPGATASPLPAGLDSQPIALPDTYFNGVSYSTTVASGAAIGDIQGYYTYSPYFDGALGLQIAFQLTAITPPPLSQYDTTVLADSPKAYWPCSDTAATTSGKLLDRSGNGYHMTPHYFLGGGEVWVGQPSLIPSAPQQTSVLLYEPSNPPNTGSNGYYLSALTPSAVSAISIECTIDTTLGDHTVDSDQVGCNYAFGFPATAGFRISSNWNGSVGWLVSDGTTEGVINATGVSPGVHHLIGTWSAGGIFALYIDGVLSGTVTNPPPTSSFTASAALSFMYNPAGYACTTCGIAGVGYFETALSAGQVAAHYGAWT